MRHDGIPTAINLLYLLALQATVRMLRHKAGLAPEMASLAAPAKDLAQLLRQHHFDPARQVFADCVAEGRPSAEASVHVNLLAIEAGLSDPPGALLDRTWKQPGILQMVGPFFRVHLFEVLHRLGRRNELVQEIRETWGEYLDAGLTTTPEYCAINGEWGASVGHPWGASPAIYLVKTLVGLSPITPGWGKTLFNHMAIHLPGIRFAVPTPHGPIAGRLDLAGANRSGEIRVPRDVALDIPDESLPQSVNIHPY
jgi:hypothetical protein